VESLMNPSGHSVVVDPWNAAIVRATRGRSFGPGGIDANVLPHVDVAATIAAYEGALRANLTMRNTGVVDAMQANAGSVRAAAPALREAMQLDEHLGDVTSFVAQLLLRDGRPDGAARMWELSARLYPPGDPRGRAAERNARAVSARR